jgi:hypothetical protein
MKDNNCEQLFFPTATETEDLPQSEVANVDNAAEVVTVDDNPEVVTVDDHPEVVTVDDEPEVVTVSPNEDTQDDAMQNASQFLEVSNDVIQIFSNSQLHISQNLPVPFGLSLKVAIQQYLSKATTLLLKVMTQTCLLSL